LEWLLETTDGVVHGFVHYWKPILIYNLIQHELPFDNLNMIHF
jgi:hypothetical protein